MAKVSFTNLKLKVNENVEKFKIGDTEIEVLQYLPIKDKYDLIMVTLQQSWEENNFNPIKMDKNFNLNLVYMYTNLNITEKQKEDSDKIYDILETNGIIKNTINLIPEEEYELLFNYLSTIADEKKEYENSIKGLIYNVMRDMTSQNEVLEDILTKFNKDDFQEVLSFAQAANGGRPIN